MVGVVGVVGTPQPAHAQLAPGDIVVVDYESGDNGTGALFWAG
jgi:hypothetical protein